jgi:myo-inositol-1(or 4)-monophosphatase
MNFENICKEVVILVKNTGHYITTELEKRESIQIESKGLHNYVTHVDLTSEKMLIEGLSKIVPGSGFIAEEGTNTTKAKVFNWVIDPLDGTTNYIHGLPPFAISVALMQNKEIVLGVIYEMGLKECFYAWKEGKAFLNGKEIRVTDVSRINDSLIATGFPYHNYMYLDNYMKTIKYFMKNSHGLRRLGSAATDIAYVACGRFEGFYEYGLNPWDVAAGVIILNEAGGKVSDFKGGRNYLFGGEIIATNANVFDEFLAAVNKLMIKKDI